MLLSAGTGLCYTSFKIIDEAELFMIITDRWNDYELLDAGHGEKLERWGRVVLQRPDPQAIWEAPHWTGQDAVYHRSKKGGGHWEYLKKLPDSWIVSYPSTAGNLRFRVEPTGFKHTGLFPEQGSNWDFIADKVMKAKEAGEAVRVLNLFAYTGGATVAAAAGGADEVVHVDASKGMNQRAKENLELSGLSGSYTRILADDVLKFTSRELRRERRYTGIIMDPPSYGRGPGGEVWKLEETLWPLVKQTVQLLDTESPHCFFILNAYTTGLAASVLANLLNLAMQGRGHTMADELGLPASRRKLVLPCGSTCRWQNEEL